ncbi:MAG: sigma 54-interacting transcriptional regulator [Magnetococcales bacterium]|nr:sigma 54-interacting transcriptional regulator [Magnetococcales bacterium]
MASLAFSTSPDRLSEIKSRLEQARRALPLDDYDGLLRFFVKILPAALEAERCSLFIYSPAAGKIWLKFGTGVEEKGIEAPLEGSVVGRVVATGQGTIENDLQRRTGFHSRVDSQTGFVTRNLICMPIKSLTTGAVSGAIQALNKKAGRSFGETDMALLDEAGGLLASAIENVHLRQEMVELSSRMHGEFERLRTTIGGRPSPIAVSQSMREALTLARMVSGSPVNVVIFGENGTGKEVIARMIHDPAGRDGRGDRSFVAVNCAATPETLIESEFFGYEKGAFTGADAPRKGKFEEAEGGTLFLDEVGEMPLSIQPKFLRAIQEREGCRLGGNTVRPYRFRLVSATNVDLRERIRTHQFREDLFYRLYSVEIKIPPLRERREDILPLAAAFLDETRTRFGKWIEGLTPDVVEMFENYAWPGNVRQLRQEIERLVALTPEGGAPALSACSEELRLSRAAAPRPASDQGTMPQQVMALERRLILHALGKHHGNKVKTAAQLGITRQGLHKMMARLGLRDHHDA